MANLKEKNSIKKSYLEKISSFLENQGEEVLRTKDNVISFPIVYGDGEEGFITVTLSIPAGSRDGEAYDGYSEAETYRFNLEEKAKKAQAAAEAKAKKIARDKKLRESASKKKADRE